MAKMIKERMVKGGGSKPATTKPRPNVTPGGRSFDDLVKATCSPEVQERGHQGFLDLLFQTKFYTASPYKDDGLWEVKNPQGEVVSLPMSAREAEQALQWLDSGYRQASLDLFLAKKNASK